MPRTSKAIDCECRPAGCCPGDVNLDGAVQLPRRQTRLEVLRQQNALQQQQFAVQSAVQQTNLLVQNAYQRIGQQYGSPSTAAFQSQMYALQIALQQTSGVLQATARSNPALVQSLLRQQNTLQTALQQTISVLATVSSPGGQLQSPQLQMLSQEQHSLMGLLIPPPAPLPRRTTHR